MEGTPFGRYRLVELLGRGGMGEVWRAYDTDTDRVVALKLLPPHLAQDFGFSERFRREAQAAARLNDPHIIPIHHYGEIDGRLYVDMRLVEGRDLHEVLADGPLDPGRAVRIVEQVAKALHAAHKIGLIHRDVKPSNVLLDEDDFAYLIDFGIARGADQTGLTSTGAMIGTWHYMAPERMGGREVDARSDIYALACVLYECLTGSRPFPGNTLESQVAAHLHTPPPRPSRTRPQVAAEFDAVIAKGMAKQPHQRYQSTVEFARAARDAVTVPIPRPPATPRQRSTQRAPAPVPAPSEPAQEPRLPTPGDVASPPTQQRPPPQPPAHRHTPPADRPSPTPRPRRKPLIISAAALLTATIVAVAVTFAATNNDQPRAPSSESPSSAGQTTLPFPDLNEPRGVAVDAQGAVYVADWGNARVLRLAAGSSTPTTLPFGDLSLPSGVAVDAQGAVYVADWGNARVLRLAAGSSTPTTLPFGDLKGPHGVAVDAQGAVYVTGGYSTGWVLRLAAGSTTTTPTTLPFPGLYLPRNVAVDAQGAVYVADGQNARVLRLAAGSTTPTTLPFTNLIPYGVAVDAQGAVYVTDTGNHRVLRLAAGSTTPTTLPFTNLIPYGVAVDAQGAVYVTDTGNHRVLRLAAGSTTPTTLPFTDLSSPTGIAVDAQGAVYVTGGVGTGWVLRLPAGSST